MPKTRRCAGEMETDMKEQYAFELSVIRLAERPKLNRRLQVYLVHGENASLDKMPHEPNYEFVRDGAERYSFNRQVDHDFRGELTEWWRDTWGILEPHIPNANWYDDAEREHLMSLVDMMHGFMGTYNMESVEEFLKARY